MDSKERQMESTRGRQVEFLYIYIYSFVRRLYLKEHIEELQKPSDECRKHIWKHGNAGKL